MDLIFPKAEVLLQKGYQQWRPVRSVSLAIREENDKSKIHKAIKSQFLNGKLQVRGTLIENCQPNASAMQRNNIAHLKLLQEHIWTMVDVVFVDILNVTTPEKWRRDYQWEFIVVGMTMDSLNLFPDAEGEFLDMDELISLLGATREDINKNIKFDSEGGFRE